MLVSVFFPAWVWLRMPSTKIICSSYSFKIAEELASKCLKLIQSDLYQAVIKFKLTKLSLENIKNSKGGQRFVTSTGGTITGVHADIIINDDPNSPQAIYSVAARTEAKRFVTEILPSRKTNIKKSYTITVQQRLHNDDISGCLLNLKQPINHICIPAIDKDNKSFFSERFPIDFLLQMKEQLGSVSFNAQYLQRTQEATGGIIKKIWIREDFIEEGKPFYFIDSAYGGKNADDNAVLGCYKKDNYLYLYSLELNKFEFPELIHWLQNNLPPTAKVYIEGKASGKSIIQTLKQQTRFNIVEIQPKGSKLERKHAVSPFFEGGRVVINKNIKHKQTLIEQLIFDETRNDDALDVVMHAIEQLLKVNKGVYNIR
jgi:predicted phage terminase large subunit-like protein